MSGTHDVPGPLPQDITGVTGLAPKSPSLHGKTCVDADVPFAEGGDDFLLPSALALLPTRDVVRLGRACRRLHGEAVSIGPGLLRLRHPSLQLGRWPASCWWFAASCREAASFLEDFGEDWQGRWQHSGSPSYVKAWFAALAVGPPFGHTLFPGSGVLCALPSPMRPRAVSWLTCAQGVSKGGDGRVGCLTLQERRGLEMIRVYFNRGSLWWEQSAADPVMLLPEGVFRDSTWYHIRCQLDWASRTADVCIRAPDSGDGVVFRHWGVGWHSAGCEQVAELAAGSVVFGSSPLSGSQAYLAEVCIE